MYELRDWQKTAYNLIKEDSGIVTACTGSGKTAVALQLIHDNPNDKILIVVPTIVLATQWYKEIVELELMSADEISRIGGGYKELPSNKVTIAVINSLQTINLDSDIAAFDHAIFDECHRYASENSLQVIRALRCDHKVGLTATLERPDGDHKYLISFIGPVKYVMDLGTDEAKKYVSEFEIVGIPLDLTDEEQEEYTRHNQAFLSLLPKFGYDITKIFKQMGRSSDARMAQKSMINRKSVIQDCQVKRDQVMAQVALHSNQKILIFDEKQDNARLIYEELLSLGYRVGIYHSGIPKKQNLKTIEAYKNNETDILVTVRALDEGMNVPNINVAIIANGNSQKRQFFQRLGRAIRKEEGKKAKLIMLYCDNTHEVGIVSKRMGYLQ